MRILFAGQHSSRIAGAETYVASAMEALSERGHSVALLAEQPPGSSRGTVAAHHDAWCVNPEGEAEAVRRAREWRPDVVYVHGLESVELERALLAVAPAVLFPHDYIGLCISGTRTWQAVGTTCSRSLGPGCLLKYFPCRCGGRSPVTMWREYTKQRARQDLHSRYRAIVVASWHMASMYAANGVTHRVHVLPPLIAAPARLTPRERGTPIKMVYAGRLERLKGVHLLIEAAMLACAHLSTGGELHIAGDGPLQPSLEVDAGKITDGRLRVHLYGWVDEEARDRLFAAADLVLVPSLWPEPFGRVGPEAARFGVPAVGFASGGIPEWLRDGVSGTLASETSAAGLAEAIVRATRDPRMYRQLSEGALTASAAVSPGTHAHALERVFGDVTRGTRCPNLP